MPRGKEEEEDVAPNYTHTHHTNKEPGTNATLPNPECPCNGKTNNEFWTEPRRFDIRERDRILDLAYVEIAGVCVTPTRKQPTVRKGHKSVHRGVDSEP